MLYNHTTRQYAAYTNAHHTVNKTRQIVMLYEGTIRFMHQAKTAIQQGDVEKRYNMLTKTSAIISGLQSALDFTQGGNIAKILDDYYFSIDIRIMSIHQSNSVEMCDQVIKELQMMCDAWEEVDKVSSGSSQDTAPNTPVISNATDVGAIQFSI